MLMGLLGILLALALLIGMAYRGWSVLLLAPAAALVAAGVAGEPVLAHWTQTFMPAAAGFLAQFFPIFLLGALFGKLMDDSGSVRAISAFMAEKMGPRHAILAVVLAGAFVTYGGVSLFVAFFVLAPMAHSLFKAANIPNHLMPAAIVLGTSTFTMSALPGTPSIQNAIPMPFFGTTPFAAPGLGVIASLIMMGFGMWWLGRAEAGARRAGVGYEEVSAATHEKAADDALVRERAVASHEFDPQEMAHGKRSAELPAVWAAALPLVVVVAVNLVMSFWVLPRMDVAFLQEPQWGQTTLAGVGGRLVGGGGTGGGDCFGHRAQLVTPDQFARQHGCGCQCVGPASLERGQPGGFWRCGGGLAGICDGQGLGAGYRRGPAGFSGGLDQCAGGSDGLCIGRSHHRTGGLG